MTEGSRHECSSNTPEVPVDIGTKNVGENIDHEKLSEKHLKREYGVPTRDDQQQLSAETGVQEADKLRLVVGFHADQNLQINYLTKEITELKSIVQNLSTNQVKEITELKDTVQTLKKEFEEHDKRVDKVEDKVDAHAKELLQIVKSYTLDHERQCSHMLEKTKTFITDDITERQKKAEENMTREHEQMTEGFNAMKSECTKHFATQLQDIKSMLSTFFETDDERRQNVVKEMQRVVESQKSLVQSEEKVKSELEKVERQLKDHTREKENIEAELAEIKKEHQDFYSQVKKDFSAMEDGQQDISNKLNETDAKHQQLLAQTDQVRQENREWRKGQIQQEMTNQISQAIAKFSTVIDESEERHERRHAKLLEALQSRDLQGSQDLQPLQSQDSEHNQASAGSVQIPNSVEDDQPSPSLHSENGKEIFQPDDHHVHATTPTPYGEMIILTVDDQDQPGSFKAEGGNLHSAVQDQVAGDDMLSVNGSTDGEDSTAETVAEIPQPPNTSVLRVPPNGQLTLANGKKLAREDYTELKLLPHHRLQYSVRIMLDTDEKLAQKILQFLDSSEEKKTAVWNSVLDILRSNKVDPTYGCVLLHAFPRSVDDAKTLFESAKVGQTATKLRQLLLSDDFLRTYKVEERPRMDVIAIEQDFVDVFEELGKRDIESRNYLLEKQREHPRRPNTVRLVIDGPYEEEIRSLRERFPFLKSQKSTSSDDQVETEGASAAVDELGVAITDVRDGCILLDLEITNQEEAEELLRKLKSGKIDDIIKKIAKPVVENTDTLQISYFENDFEDVVNDLGAASEERKDAFSGTSATAAKTDKGYICGLAPPSAEVFVGRENILDKIYRSYKGCKQDILEEVSKDNLVHVLTGNSGIGKTQIAVNYAHKYHEDYPKGIFWFNAISMAGLDHGFRCMFERLNLRADVDGDKDCLQAKEIKSQALQWLQLNPGWLLVLDDANDLELMKHYFPAFPCKGHIIITSKQTSFKNVLPGITEEILTSPLTTAAATKLLLCCQGTQPSEVYVTIRKMEESDSKEHQALCEVVKALKGFPQALELAGSYIHHTKSTFANYKDNILSSQSHQICHKTTNEQIGKDKDMCHTLNSCARDSIVRREMCKEDSHPGDEGSSKMSLERHRNGKEKMVFVKKLQPSAWTMLRQQIKARRHGPDALKLLDISAFFHSTISKSLLTKEIPSKRSKSIDDHHIPLEKEKQTPQSEPDGRFSELLLILHQHNLVVLMSSREPVFSIQTLTKNLVKESLLRKSQKYIETVNDAVELLKREFPKKSEMCKLEIPLPPEKEEIVLHTQVLRQTFTESFVKENKTTLLDPVPLFNRTGFYLKAIKRRPREAESLYETSFHVAKILLSSESPELSDLNLRKLAGAYYNLGSVYFDLSRVEQALQYQKEGKKLTLQADALEEKRRKNGKGQSCIDFKETQSQSTTEHAVNGNLQTIKNKSEDSTNKVCSDSLDEGQLLPSTSHHVPIYPKEEETIVPMEIVDSEKAHDINTVPGPLNKTKNDNYRYKKSEHQDGCPDDNQPQCNSSASVSCQSKDFTAHEDRIDNADNSIQHSTPSISDINSNPIHINHACQQQLHFKESGSLPVSYKNHTKVYFGQKAQSLSSSREFHQQQCFKENEGTQTGGADKASGKIPDLKALLSEKCSIPQRTSNMLNLILEVDSSSARVQ
ncbi:uncharacterized protein [Ptychodera flava]|uniref:uncharacterized protein n=1 Tax=Ptychodera flava TaxID=63121 RepID=UPI00396A9D4F